MEQKSSCATSVPVTGARVNGEPVEAQQQRPLANRQMAETGAVKARLDLASASDDSVPHAD